MQTDATCKFGNYLRIRGGSRKLNANGRTLFANEMRRAVMIFGWLRPSMAQFHGNNGVEAGVVHNNESRGPPADRASW